MKDRLGDFEILDPIDPGGYTLVYRAVEHMGQGITRPAAVKVLQALNLDNTEQLEILRREVEVLVELTASPNIVTIYGFGIDEEVGPWLAMELAGQNLKHFITDQPAEPDDVRMLLRDTLRALSVVHRAKPPILHRDIKPNNILSSEFNTWKIADFGLAKRHESDETLNVATVQYAAPELLDATLGPESPKMDLYSLGMVVYEFALGRKLYREQFPSIYDRFAESDELGSDDRPKWMYWHTSPQMTIHPLAEVIEDYPQDLSDLVAAMTAKPLRERLSAADDALAALGDMSGTMLALPRRGAPMEESEAGHSGVRTLAIALVAIVLMVALFAVMIPLVMTAHPVIHLAGDGMFTANRPEIVVTGRIEDFPGNGAATVMLGDGSSFPVYVDDDGRFTSQVELGRLGETEGALVITDRAGQQTSRRLLKLHRSEPEAVHVTLQTKPSASNADVVLTLLDDPERPIRLVTDSNGRAAAEVKFGQFEVEITHPRFRRLVDTANTGIDPEKVITARLAVLSVERLSDKREQLLTEMDQIADAAAAGDPEAVARLEQIRRQLKQLEPVEGDKVAARRVALLEELDEVAARAAAGDPEAVARMKEINAELRDLAAQESGAAVAGGTLDEAEGEVAQRSHGARRAELLREMAEINRRAAAGDPAAIARLREIRAELKEIEEAEGSASVVARRRTALLDELAVMTELAASGDPNAMARVEAIQRELAALAAIEAAEGDPARLAEAAGQMLGGVPALELLDRTTLLQLPAEQFRAFIEVNVPTGALRVEQVPKLSRVRISGPVFNEEEYRRLLNRLAPAEPRLQLEVHIDAWAVCRRLEHVLTQRGIEDKRVHAYLALDDNALFVQCEKKETIETDALTALACTFVINPDLVFVQRF